MAYPTKIATCCFCGTRAALVLNGTERHELACSSCGAPLHNLKMLPLARTKPAEPVGVQIVQGKAIKPARALRKKSKPRKSPWRGLFENAADFIEDILD